MSATIIAFPGASQAYAVPRPIPAPPSISAGALADKFTYHFLPIVRASIDFA